MANPPPLQTENSSATPVAVDKVPGTPQKEFHHTDNISPVLKAERTSKNPHTQRIYEAAERLDSSAALKDFKPIKPRRLEKSRRGLILGGIVTIIVVTALGASSVGIPVLPSLVVGGFGIAVCMARKAARAQEKFEAEVKNREAEVENRIVDKAIIRKNLKTNLKNVFTGNYNETSCKGVKGALAGIGRGVFNAVTLGAPAAFHYLAAAQNYDKARKALFDTDYGEAPQTATDRALMNNVSPITPAALGFCGANNDCNKADTKLVDSESNKKASAEKKPLLGTPKKRPRLSFVILSISIFSGLKKFAASLKKQNSEEKVPLLNKERPRRSFVILSISIFSGLKKFAASLKKQNSEEKVPLLNKERPRRSFGILSISIFSGLKKSAASLKKQNSEEKVSLLNNESESRSGSFRQNLSRPSSNKSMNFIS